MSEQEPIIDRRAHERISQMAEDFSEYRKLNHAQHADILRAINLNAENTAALVQNTAEMVELWKGAVTLRKFFNFWAPFATVWGVILGGFTAALAWLRHH